MALCRSRRKWNDNEGLGWVAWRSYWCCMPVSPAQGSPFKLRLLGSVTRVKTRFVLFLPPAQGHKYPFLGKT